VYDVGCQDYSFVDRTRPTPPNGKYAGATSRTLETTLWYPKEATGTLPLLIYSHGFLSHRRETEYLAEHLASHGFLVAAADHPVTNGDAPGGPDVWDVLQQPADVSFLIDSVLALDGAERPFSGRVDRDRIGAMGLSLGGLTMTLVAFHPKLRDERVRAVISIAGPSAFFSRRFFETAEVPFLMIAGIDDAIVPYTANGPPILERAPTGALLSIAGGSHVGFAGLAATNPFLRFSHNPDRIGCSYLERHLELPPDDLEVEAVSAELGGPENGVLLSTELPLPCVHGDLPRAIRPPRQQIITELAVRAFFESEFAERLETRKAASRYLSELLQRDLPEAEYAGSAR
jgi:predicted dienelactone hydrolase